MNESKKIASQEQYKELISAAKRHGEERDGHVRDKNFFKRTAFVPGEPIYIASSEYIGTDRARANHVDSCLHYCKEQMVYKQENAPIE
jgi:hypothetical protein